VKSWSRTPRMLIAAFAMSLVFIITAPAAPALALNPVACNEDGYLRIWYWTINGEGDEYKASKCYANAGEDDQFYIAQSVRMWSGNNAGYVILNNAERVNFGKNEYKDLGTNPDRGTSVTFLKIN
jgi:hypothetical protein